MITNMKKTVLGLALLISATVTVALTKVRTSNLIHSLLLLLLLLLLLTALHFSL
jgi:NADH:ubiquinone oxidoreductase subunit 6 (subunit J)